MKQNEKRTMTIKNLSVDEYKKLLKFMDKKKINRSVNVVDKDGNTIYCKHTSDDLLREDFHPNEIKNSIDRWIIKGE